MVLRGRINLEYDREPTDSELVRQFCIERFPQPKVGDQTRIVYGKRRTATDIKEAVETLKDRQYQQMSSELEASTSDEDFN